jgi:hypothetical protein
VSMCEIRQMVKYSCDHLNVEQVQYSDSCA